MKRWKWFALAIVLLIGAAYATASWMGAGYLLAPPRKALRPWTSAGVRVEYGVSKKGVPYLMCVPDTLSGPGARGKVLRQQCEVAKVPLRPFGEICGTIVLLHGWGMRKENLLSTVERFCAAGFRCLVPDLPGHGENPKAFIGFGTSVEERGLPGEVLESAAETFHFSAEPAGLWGLSMGGAYAVQAAAAQPGRWTSLVVVSSFDALEPVVDGAVNGFCNGLSYWIDPGLDLAVRCRGGFWLSKVRPVENARRLGLPTLILHGVADGLIPIDGGRRLFTAVPHARKRWIEVAAGHHGNVLGTLQHVFVEMAAWFMRWNEAPGAKCASLQTMTNHAASPTAQVAVPAPRRLP